VTDSSEFKALVRERMEITGESYTQAMRHMLDAARTAVPGERRPPRPALRPRPNRPWDPPQTEFPAVVPISTTLFTPSGQTALAITGISAYSSGFEVFVTQLIRPDAPGYDDDTDRPPYVQLSLRLSDGRTVTVERPTLEETEPASPILRRRSGGGTSHYHLMRWWAWPLPPSGPLEFVSQFGTAVIDAQLILDAAQHSVQVWPG
jgi:hypothetical protein